MNPSAIITADNHLLERNPVCRLDDLTVTQWKKQRWLKRLQKEYGGIPILDGGDLFHHWKPSPALLAKSIKKIAQRTISEGNHDLPAHNLDLFHKSGLAVLLEARTIETSTPDNPLEFAEGFEVTCFPWGSELKPYEGSFKGRKIALCHVFTYPGKKPWPGCRSPRAKGIMRLLKGYDLIITGDNHQPFIIETDNQILVNPGSLCRLTAAQADHKPRVYLWDAETNEVEPVYVPIKKDVITRTHINTKEDRDERMEAFLASIDMNSGLGQLKSKHNFEVGLNFEKNLKEFMGVNKVSAPVVNIINEAVYGEGL